MSLLNSIKKGIRRIVQKNNTVSAAKGYDLWASSYDTQQDNLLIYLDRQVFAEMSRSLSYEGKVVADVGCGTGRHWETLLSAKPSRLIGYDVSREMVGMLRHKFPQAETYVLKDQSLPGLQDKSCDILLCNLVIGYIENLEATFAEWDRVLKSSGIVMISDLHPAVMQRGGDRSFTHKNKKVLIKSYTHPLQKIKALAASLGWEEEAYIEKIVDENIRPFYAAQHALHQYELMYKNNYGSSVLYGWRFKKR
jgi:ubiquinone/menaquinone biosynthesis C-methylase UbiE